MLRCAGVTPRMRRVSRNDAVQRELQHDRVTPRMRRVSRNSYAALSHAISVVFDRCPDMLEIAHFLKNFQRLRYSCRTINVRLDVAIAFDSW